MNIIKPQYVWNGELTKRDRDIYRIVLHHAAATHCTATQIHSWHKARGWVGIGYHFFITAKYKTIKLIQKHSDINATACPGKYFPFDYIAHGTKQNSDETAIYGIEVPMLARGAQGPDVLILQKMLIGNGFSCGRTKADGQFGANTEQAVKDFQKSRSILVDGIVGTQTWYKIFLKEDTHGS